MVEQIIRYLQVLEDRRKAYREQRAQATNRADYDIASEIYGSITTLDDIIHDLSEFVKTSQEDIGSLTHQALMEAYGDTDSKLDIATFDTEPDAE